MCYFGCGVVANVLLSKSKGENSGWIVVATGWGLAVGFGVYAVGRISGAHINPAVTVGQAVAGVFPWANVPMYIGAQMIGGFLGGVATWLTYLPHWKETENQTLKLAVFSTVPAIRNYGMNLLTEILATFILVFGILFIIANEFTAGLAPFIIGFYIFAIGLSHGGPTGYAINPARDLGPRIAHLVLPIAGKGDSDWAYSWVPVVGPLIGGVLGGLFFALVYGGFGWLGVLA
ncbi:aquaporin family protein [Dehalococcoidia bacterium]|nr:aquaporin family protein [Dehalococcoidia bacterium]